MSSNSFRKLKLEKKSKATTETGQQKEAERYQKIIQSNTESFLDAYTINKKMLVESITETHFAIKTHTQFKL